MNRIYAALNGVSLLLPVSAFCLGFTNELMSENMSLLFDAVAGLGFLLVPQAYTDLTEDVP